MTHDEKIKSLQEENKKLKELLKETLYAMCDYRTIKGYCSKCNTLPYCPARKVIPKVEVALGIKAKDTGHIDNVEKGEQK